MNNKLKIVYSLSEVAVLWAAAFLGSWLLWKSELALQAVEVLRLNYFIFTKERHLKYHVYLALDTWVLKTGLVLFLFALLAARRQNPYGKLGLGRGTKKVPVFFTMLFCGFALAVGIRNGFDVLAPNLPTSLFFKESAAIGNTLALFSSLVVAPLTEEIFFRGYMLPVLASALGAEAAVLVTGLLFAGVHWPQVAENWQSLAIYVTVGLWLSAARLQSGSTRYPIFLHLAYNLMIALTGFWRYWIDGF